MMTYAEADRLFRTARDEEKGKPLATATYLQKRPNAYAVRYHNTDVVLIHISGIYVLNNGGYFTRTTRKRIIQYAPVWLIQRDGAWYLNGEFWPNCLWGDGKVRVDSAGHIIRESEARAARTPRKLKAASLD